MAWLANSLFTAGHEVTLVTFQRVNDSDYSCHKGIRRGGLGIYRYLDSSRISAYVNLYRWRSFLKKAVRKSQADVVVSFIDGMNVYCLLSLLGSQVPVVVAERTDPAHSLLSPKKKFIRLFLYRIKAKSVVFQTEAIAAIYQKLWRLDNVQVIPNAVQSALIGNTEVPTRKIVLAVGRLDFQKGHDILVNAWALLGDASDGWTLRIVGDGVDRSNYIQLVAALGLVGKVEFPGFIQDVASEYQMASVVVLPSRVEGFPNALLEAMAAGKPVVVSDLPDACREVVQHGVNGLLYEGSSPAALAAALRQLLGDERLRAQLAIRAVEVRQRYSEQAVYSLWEQCLKDACT